MKTKLFASAAVIFAAFLVGSLKGQCADSKYLYVTDHNLASSSQSGVVRVDKATGAQEVVTQGGYLGDTFWLVQESPATLLVATETADS